MRAGSRQAVVAAVLVSLAGVAAADPAGAEFDRGRALLADGKYADACAAFAHSQQLDPQFGTLYNLANCSAKLGKSATAWRAYRELAEHDPNARRRADADERARALEPTLPRLQLTAPSPDWTATLDGADATAAIGAPLFADPGEHELVATSRAGAYFRKTITLAASPELVTIAIRAMRTPAEVVRRRNATIAIASGSTLVALGLAFGLSTAELWSDAKPRCGGDTRCPDASKQAQATALADRARSRGTPATLLTLAGGAALGAGIWLWKRDRREAIRITPGTDAAPAGVTVGGRF